MAEHEPTRLVLVLGWKPGLNTVLKRAGAECLVVLSNEEVIRSTKLGELPADYLAVTDTSDHTAVLTELLRHRPDHSEIVGVCALNERAVIPAAFLGAALGVRALSPLSALAARDKHLQKTAVRASGTKTASTMIVFPEDLDDACPVPGTFRGFPLVVKPLSGVGAALTSKVENAIELREAVHAVTSSSDLPIGALVEEFMPGVELHMDGYVVDGEVRFASVSRYADNVLSVREGAVVQSVIVDSRSDRQLYDQATQMASASLNALGITSSVFHIEFFVDAAGQLIFSECGARPGGGYIVQAVEAKFGIDLREVALRLAAGLPLPAAKTSAESTGFSFLAAAPGRIASRPDDREILALPGVKRVFYPYEQGEDVPDASSSSGQRLGLVLVQGVDDDQLESRLETVVQFVWERTRTEQPGLVLERQLA